MRRVLAVDPGSEKCGVAVVGTEGVLHREIVPRASIIRAATELAARHFVEQIIVGDGTGSGKVADDLRAATAHIHLELVDESFTTLKARARYFEENPPRGIRRMIPRGLLLPDRPYDDYVAVILAEEYLKRKA